MINISDNIVKLLNPLGDERTDALILTAQSAVEAGDDEAAVSVLQQFLRAQAGMLEHGTMGSIYSLDVEDRGPRRGYILATIDYAKALQRELRGEKAVTNNETETMAAIEKRMLVSFFTGQLERA